MKRIIATFAAGILAAGLATAGTVAAASAAEPVQAEVCYEDTTTTELTYELQRSDWVAPVPATIESGWYTESDDAAPTASDTGLTFTAPGGKAVGLRQVTNFSLEDLSGESYTDVFHDRAVLDAEGTPFSDAGLPAWRDDYTSLTFLSADTVYVSGLNVVKTLAEVKAEYSGTITSFGYHLDSNAAAGTSEFVSGHVIPSTPEHYTDWYKVSSGQGAELPDGRANDEEFQTDGLYRYHVTGEVEVPTQVEVGCPAVVVPPVETPVASEAPVLVIPAEPVDTASEVALADTGFDGTPWIVGGIILLVIGGGAVFAQRKLASK